MRTFQIGEKEYDFKLTYGKHLKLLKRYKDVANAINWDMDRYNAYIFDVIWAGLEKKRFFKPFLTKKSMMFSMTLKELRWFQLNIGKIISGDDDFTSLEEFDNKNKKVEKKTGKKQK